MRSAERLILTFSEAFSELVAIIFTKKILFLLQNCFQRFQSIPGLKADASTNTCDILFYIECQNIVCSILSSIPYLPISTDIYDRFFTKNRIGQTASVNAENRTVCRFSPFKSISKPIVPTLLASASVIVDQQDLRTGHVGVYCRIVRG